MGIAVVAMCGACGCSRRATTPKGPAGAAVAVAQGGDKVENKGGTVPAAGAVSIPEDYPKDIPIYPGARPTVHTAAKTGRMLELKTSDAADKVSAFYKEKLKAEGWKQESEST